jgi:hypothetical protein
MKKLLEFDLKKKFGIVLTTLLLISLITIAQAGNLDGTSVLTWNGAAQGARLDTAFTSGDASTLCYRIMIDTWQTGGILKEPVSSLSLPSGCSIDNSVPNEGWGTKTLTISCDPGLPDGTYDLIDVLMEDANGEPMDDFSGLQITHWFNLPPTPHPDIGIWWGKFETTPEEGVFQATFGGFYPIPVPMSMDPAWGATGVLGNPPITVKFNEWISEDSSGPLTGTITVNDGTKNIDFDYAWAYADELHFGNYVGPWLAPNTMYTVTIADFKDLFGTPMTSPVSWTFTTGEDTTPPTVISTNPADDEIKVPVNIGSITITFSEPIVYDPAAWYDEISLRDSSGSDVPYGWIIVSENKMGISAGPQPWFDNWEDYYVRVMGRSVKDLAGNELVDGTNDYYRFHFKTVSTDTTPPSIISTDPVNGAYNVPLDVIITATMDEKIGLCDGPVTMVDSHGNSVALQNPTRGYTSPDYIHVVITPVAPLAVGETYTVTIQKLFDMYHR